MKYVKTLWSCKEYLLLYGLILFHLAPVVIDLKDSLLENYIKEKYQMDVEFKKRIEIKVHSTFEPNGPIEKEELDENSPDFKG